MASTAIAVLAFVPIEILAAAKVQLRVLETTDIHVHLMGYDYYQDRPDPTVGLARTAALIAAARAEARNSVLVDNGDLLQGNPLGDFVARKRGLAPGEVHPVYKAMNLLGYTVANIGNHEFNFGLEFLRRSIDGAEFPYISANVFHDDGDDDDSNDEPYFDQYLIVDRILTAEDGTKHEIRIGFIGFVPPQILQWDASHLKGKVVAHDIVTTASALVPQMKAEGADVIVAIPHSGISTHDRRGMDENAVYYLSKIAGIDALMFGHSHRVFPSADYADIPGVDVAKGTINGVPATMPGFWGNHLGYVDLTLTVSDDAGWRVTDGVGGVWPIHADDKPLVEPADDVLAAIRRDHQATLEYMRTGVGEITTPISSYFALVRDDASVQIVTDAQKRYAERLLQGTEYDALPVLSASAPFKAGGRSGNFTMIDAGKIALKDVADLYVYPNTLRVVRITGSELREWLEMSAGIFNRIDPDSDREQTLINPRFPSFNFDVVDGVTYSIDVTKAPRYDGDGNLINPDSYRISALEYAGKPVTAAQVFAVATNNYRADGGGNFPGLDGSNVIVEAPDSNRDVLSAYILERESLNPSADGNWSFVPISNDVFVTFESAAAAAGTLPPGSRITFIEASEDGTGRYRISFQRPSGKLRSGSR